MIPTKRTLNKIKKETYINALRLYFDACLVYEHKSYASAFAFAVLSLEEIGKLYMIDHVIDEALQMSPSSAQEWVNHLFDRKMFYSHRNKQMWASIDSMYSRDRKRIEDIDKGKMEIAKQDALYVGYRDRRIRLPQKITQQKAYAEIYILFEELKSLQDFGLVDIDDWSNSKTRAKARRYLLRIEKAIDALGVPRRKS